MKIGLIGINSQFVHSSLALYYLRETAPDQCQCVMKEYNINEPILETFLRYCRQPLRHHRDPCLYME